LSCPPHMIENTGHCFRTLSDLWHLGCKNQVCKVTVAAAAVDAG